MLKVKLTYIVELDPQQFRVIMAALRGELKQEWREEALQLQDELFRVRNEQVQNQLGNIAKLIPGDLGQPLGMATNSGGLFFPDLSSGTIQSGNLKNG